MPQVIEVPIEPALLTGGTNRSGPIPVNNAQFVALLMQFSAVLSAGQWVLRSAATPDSAINGAIIATLNFSATDRVLRAAVEVCDKWVYVQQVNAPVGGTIEKVSVLYR
jgi:hypothetical protein